MDKKATVVSMEAFANPSLRERVEDLLMHEHRVAEVSARTGQRAIALILDGWYDAGIDGPLEHWQEIVDDLRKAVEDVAEPVRDPHGLVGTGHISEAMVTRAFQAVDDHGLDDLGALAAANADDPVARAVMAYVLAAATEHWVRWVDGAFVWGTPSPAPAD